MELHAKLERPRMLILLAVTGLACGGNDEVGVSGGGVTPHGSDTGSTSGSATGGADGTTTSEACPDDRACAQGACCKDGELCSAAVCVASCDGVPACGDAGSCCDATEVCYQGQCIAAGADCGPPTCTNQADAEGCDDGDVCDPAVGKCLPAQPTSECEDMPADGQLDEPCFPDLTLVALEVASLPCPDLELSVWVENEGCLGTCAGVKVAFYEATHGLLGVVETTAPLVGGAAERVQLSVPRPMEGGEYEVWAVADDDGTGVGVIAECTEDDNAHGPVAACQTEG